MRDRRSSIGRCLPALALVLIVALPGIPGRLGVPEASPPAELRAYAPSTSDGSPARLAGPPAPSAAPSPPSGTPGPGTPQARFLDGPIAPPIVPIHRLPGAVPTAPYPVDPSLAYSSEPAPMGIGDFGLTANGTPYTYSTFRFLGTVDIGSISTQASGGAGGGWVSIQLNVVLRLTHGGTEADYWIQDVPLLDTSSGTVYFVDNVWNMSGPSATMRTSSIHGNGSVSSYGGTNFYEDQAPGSDDLTFPQPISAEVVASSISGVPHVGFLYDDGSGWTIYDNVTFPWAKGWTTEGFVVNGSAYNPSGIFWDAEMVFGGPGGGSTASDISSNVTIELESFNGHNFAPVPNAGDFGSDTAETISNVVESLPSGPSPGAPSALLVGGSGALGFLYGRADVGVLNLSGLAANGTLFVNGTPTAYRGGLANTSLRPGTYSLFIRNATASGGRANLTVVAGRYYPLEGRLAPLSFSPSSALPGANVTVTGGNFTPASVASVLWQANGSALCNATVTGAGAFSCTFRVPRAANGPYTVLATDNASAPATDLGSFAVSTTLSVTAQPSVASTDAGIRIHFVANATGGVPPYVSYAWRFGDGQNVTTTSASIDHAYARGGTFNVTVVVTDSLGSRVTSATSVNISADPHVALPSATRPSADVGQSVSFSTSASLGSGGYTYAWTGLPPGCTTAGQIASCSDLADPGTYSISVSVTDAAGARTASGGLGFRVFPDPVAVTPTASPPTADVGQPVVLRANVTSGSGGFTYLWLGLPATCGGYQMTLTCAWPSDGTSQITVRATDSNGVAATAPDLELVISPDPTITSITPDRASADVGQTVTFTAATTPGSGTPVYLWTGLPVGCAGANSSGIVCTAARPGTYSVTLTLNDSNDGSATSRISYEIFPPPSVGPITASPRATEVGRNVTYSLTVSGGSGGFSYSWSGLPTGCASNQSTATCTPGATGTDTIFATVTDSNGARATTANLTYTINPALRITGITVDPAAPLQGQSFTISASVVGGTGNLTYRWAGLPTGCAAANASRVTCTWSGSGDLAISLTVSDAAGARTNLGRTVTVGLQFLGVPIAEGIGAVVGMVVAIVLLIVFLGRRAAAAPRPAAKPRRAAVFPAPLTPSSGAGPGAGPSEAPELSGNEPDGWRVP
ncbi:MAG TPA: thermopsin family protease [Thermoplasmata archaeon]|nr:thermopsin family protease [Thermoplasmata archaeon]